MAQEVYLPLNRFRIFLRYIIFGTFPLGLLLSVPFPITTPRRYWGYSDGTAAAVGVIFLFLSSVLSLFDTGIFKRWRERFGEGKYEYRIMLPTSEAQKEKHRRGLWLLFVSCADLTLLIAVAIVLGFTMDEVNNTDATMLVVYAALPYFIAGTSHVLLLCCDLASLYKLYERGSKKQMECPNCHHAISQSPGTKSPQQHSPAMTGALATGPEQETGTTQQTEDV